MSLFPTRPGKFTWRMLATVLGSEAVVVFFGALLSRGLAGGGDSHFVELCVLAVLSLVAAGLVRRPGGVWPGWVVQVLIVVSAFVVPMMWVIALVFVGLWVLSLVQGARIDAEVAARERAGSAVHEL